MPTFETTVGYRRCLQYALGREARVVSTDRFDSFLSSREPGDEILIIDPRCFPIDLNDLTTLVAPPPVPRSVRHLVALDGTAEGTRELVQFDSDRLVRRIDRLYEGVTWIQVSGVACSWISVAAALHLDHEPFTSLAALRERLAACGMPSQDVSVTQGAVDLTEENALLDLAEWQLLRDVEESSSTTAASRGGVLVGQRCSIDPTARISGPVRIQDDAVIEPEVVLIGPTLIGAGAHIGRNSVLAQCLVLRESAVPRETAVRHHVLGTADGASVGSHWDLRRRPWVRSGGLRIMRPSAYEAAAARHRQYRVQTYRAFKRVFDAAVALTGLIILWPLLLAAAAVVKLGSRGPVLYCDEREGKDGCLFRCYKFRTMVEGAHGLQRDLYGKSIVDGPQFKLAHDPRVTGAGHWLRAANIDELPQLINVLLGQMSLIGPRPSPFRENQICVPWRRARLSIRPGITGLWQICRHERSAGDFHQWIFYDMLYVRHMSFWLDLKILASTLLTLGGRWAVPLSWLIPNRKVYGCEDPADVVTWAPAMAPVGPANAEASQGFRDRQRPGETTTSIAGRERCAPIRREWLEDLRQMALRGLSRMYRPEQRLFAFRIRRTREGDVLEGVSDRYTATVLIGLANESSEVVSSILASHTREEVCDRLIDRLEQAQDLGGVALALWAARVLNSVKAGEAVKRLRGMMPEQAAYPVVELAWALAALAVDSEQPTDDPLAESVAQRLLASFSSEASVFPHWPGGVRPSNLRPHVSCFADQIYPIQALGYYHARTGNARALDVANCCAQRICDLQGAAGQWWWHYDARTGRVVEGYPVYAVHQDAMAPMALFALRQVGGDDHRDSVERGLSWLAQAPETGSSLVDGHADMIWRKVARHEFTKWARGAQALVSRLHPQLRVPGLSVVAPPHAVDYECRPYHLGWLLHAWPGHRIDSFLGTDVQPSEGEVLHC
ncbi:MAG: sugar transferase [Phycisphaerae bacterium]|nr:sugar transferase [Phycisphaerae bacterium]